MNFLRLKLITGLFLIAMSTGAFCQNKQTRLETFIKVWGFLKYHHQNIAAGTINWDSVFISHLPNIRKLKDNRSFNNQIKELIDAAGSTGETIAKLPDSAFTLNHDLAWLKSSTLLNDANKVKLQFIYDHRNQGPNRFVKFKNYTDYSGENQYKSMIMPNEQYRLLFLARFWNAIGYFAPYKYVIGEDWNKVLTRFIPKMSAAKDTVAYYKTLMQLAVSLHDGHAQLAPDDGTYRLWAAVYGKNTPELFCDIIGKYAVIRKGITDTILPQKIAAGDIILRVDGKPVTERMRQLYPLVSGSNKNEVYHMMSSVLLATDNEHEILTLKRGRKILTVTVDCLPTVKHFNFSHFADIFNYTNNPAGFKYLTKDIACIYPTGLWAKTIDSVIKVVKSTKAIIIDTRNYTTNDAQYKLVNALLPARKFINNSLQIMPDNPGFFKWVRSASIGKSQPDAYKGKIIILVDERNQSQGEYTAMSFQTIPNAITIGSQTAGADGVVSPIAMGGGLTLSYSGYGIFYPDKTPTQRRGVKIDIPVKKTLKSFVENDDLILRKAIGYLAKQGIN